jgi:hypothetical protein
MPSYLSLLKDPYKIFRSRKERRQHLVCLGEELNIKRSERIIGEAKLCLYFSKPNENPSF